MPLVIKKFANFLTISCLGRRALLSPPNDAASSQIVRRKFNTHLITRQDSDVIFPQLSSNMSQDQVFVVQLHTEHGIRQSFQDCTFNLYGVVLCLHVRPNWIIRCVVGLGLHIPFLALPLLFLFELVLSSTSLDWFAFLHAPSSPLWR